MSIKATLLTIIVSVISTAAHAELVSRLGGLAYYDTDADLTWLADASYLKTQYVNSGGSEGVSHGRTNWATANAWAAGLNIAGVTGWRLPATFDIGNDGCNKSFGGTDCGHNVNLASSELAELLTGVLGNESYKDTDGNVRSNWAETPESGPFHNIDSGYYWSSTELVTDTSLAWVMSTNTRDQINASKTGSKLRSWAVHTGDVSSVPVPAAFWLFSSGLLGLIGISKRKRD